MIPRYLNMIVLLAVPVILLGTDPGKPKSIYHPVIPDAIRGIQIQFELREVKINLHGSTESIYCLCANITNQQDEAESILLRYECQGQARKKEIRIGGKQQKIILVDKCIMKDEINMEDKDYFSQVQLEHPQ